jgi:hypothetical protein
MGGGEGSAALLALVACKLPTLLSQSLLISQRPEPKGRIHHVVALLPSSDTSLSSSNPSCYTQALQYSRLLEALIPFATTVHEIREPLPFSSISHMPGHSGLGTADLDAIAHLLLCLPNTSLVIYHEPSSQQQPLGSPFTMPLKVQKTLLNLDEKSIEAIDTCNVIDLHGLWSGMCLLDSSSLLYLPFF